MCADSNEDSTGRFKTWVVRVRPATLRDDAHGRDILSDVLHAGFEQIKSVASIKVYVLTGCVDEEEVHYVAQELLADQVVDSYTLCQGESEDETGHAAIEVRLRPGVMNPVASSVLRAARTLLETRNVGPDDLREVQTGRRYELTGATSSAELERIGHEILANDCIETFYIQGLGRHDVIPDQCPPPPQPHAGIRRVKLQALDDAGLARLSREAHLFLSVKELETIRSHFNGLERDPTDLELETLAQTWSEHCVHKTLKSSVDYRGEDFGKPGEVEVHFNNLLKETIAATTFALNKDWCLSVFTDNAGVVALDDEYGVAFKVETHNHPSAIEPYGGAATGVGGCIRDIMGCGLGAKPIACTDVFCLAPPYYESCKLPKDVLHPRRVLKGVVAGVRDYGNRMGIPTVNGALYFDERYLANPLVFCGCVGLIPRNRIHKGAQPGDCIVVAGGRTGRDGIHGATFSSAEFTDAHAAEFSHAVQIGNAFEEKKLLDALLLARDHPEGCLYSSVTDCGAGGLSSAVGEMGADLGANVELANVPLKYSGLRYDEIWISEAQERMVFAVPPRKLAVFLDLLAAEEVEATAIGRFTADGMLRVSYRGEVVGELAMKFLHHGIPRTTRAAVWASASATQPRQVTSASRDTDGNQMLLNALSQLNTASKEWVIRQYDHEVQGRSVIKPLAGPGSGPSDAAVLQPRYGRHRGIVLGCGFCPERSDSDPYWMAVAAVDEALRNVICVGANPNRVAILDNFCWPKVDTEESLGSLVRACRGAADAALAYQLPFISGKDSLNNEFVMSEEEAVRVGLRSRIAIPETLLISALGIIEDVRHCVSVDLKRASHCLVVASAPVEQAGLQAAQLMHDRVARLINSGQVYSAHDISDGGLAVAVAEMCIASDLGAIIEAIPIECADSPFRAVSTSYVLEVPESVAGASGFLVIGHVVDKPIFRFNGALPIEMPVDELARAWRMPLASGGGGSS